MLFGAVCAIEEERFQSSAKSNCWFCSFQFSRQLVPRSRCSSGKCSIRHFPPLAGTKLYCSVTEAHVCVWTSCPESLPESASVRGSPVSAHTATSLSHTRLYVRHDSTSVRRNRLALHPVRQYCAISFLVFLFFFSVFLFVYSSLFISLLLPYVLKMVNKDYQRLSYWHAR